MYKKVCEICGKTFETSYHNQCLCTLPHPKVCANCGKTFYVRGSDKHKDYCCDKCREALHSKECVICGNKFIPKNATQVTCGEQHYNTCVVCGKKFEVNAKTKDRVVCSRSCSGKYAALTGKSKETSRKARQTCIERYGTFQYNVSRKPKICKECGREFIPASNRQEWCDSDHYRPCPICGKPVLVTYYKNKNVTCSDACRVQLIRNTCNENYGEDNFFKTEEFKAKNAQTNLKKYGVDHFSKTEEFKTKFRETSRRKYGTDNPLQNKEIKLKAIATNRQRYGSDWYIGSSTFIEKSIQSSMAKYGVPWASQMEDAKRKRINTNLKKYGFKVATQSPQVKEKALHTNMLKYGCKASSMNSNVKAKAAETCMNKFGTKSAMQCREIKQKSVETNIQKYGVPNAMFNKSIKEKQQRNCKEAIKSRYGVEYPWQSNEVRQGMYKRNIEKYGIPYLCLLPQCQSAGRTVSKINKSFKYMLDSNEIECQMEKHIGYKSYDFLIYASNILIEINPCYTHNSYHSFYGNHEGIAYDYHISKTKLAESHGYRCIHVWDWDDWDKIVSLVLETSAVYARKCIAVSISKNECDEFLSRYHLQGTCKGQNKRYALVLNGEIVQVMTFGKPRYNKNFEWELLRLCSKPGTAVIGGAQRLFSHFVKENSPQSIVSYCDRSKFSGNVYRKLGFTLESEGSPSKHWYSPRKSERMQHITDNFLRQRGFDQIFGTSFGKGTSNEQLMIDRGYLPVYDCGQMRFAWHKNQ